MTCSEGTVRDRLWIWGHFAGSHDAPQYGLTKTSRMTPAEGALYLGLPNILLIRYRKKPDVASFEQEALALSPFKRVVWSATGAGGATDEEERDATRRLMLRYSNFVGVILDDYFRTHKRINGRLVPLDSIEKIAVFGLEELKALKEKFAQRDFWVTVYTDQLDFPIKAQLELMDVVTLWTRNDDDLPQLEKNLAKLESMVPKARKILGCYMWDYLGDKKPLRVSLMKYQCELGLEWIKKGRIEGIIFLGNNICDMGLEAVDWTRRWIQQVGDDPV
jgi:hypothetical protein